MKEEPYNSEVVTGPQLKQGKPKGVIIVSSIVFLIAILEIIDFLKVKNNPIASQISSVTGGDAISIIIILLLIILGIGLIRLNILALWITIILSVLIVFSDVKTIHKAVNIKHESDRSFQELIERDKSSPLLQQYVAKEEEDRRISQNYLNREIAQRGAEVVIGLIVISYLIIPSTRKKFS